MGMLETKRNAIMNAIASGGLPSEYQQVDYIESHTSEYIDSGYIPNENTELDIEFSTATSTSDSNLFGIQESNRFMAWINTSSGKGIALHIPSIIANGTYADTGWLFKNLQTDTFYSIKVNGTLNFFVDDVRYKTIWNFAESMTIFRARGKWNNGSFKIKKFDISENGTLVRNFIPCYRIADNVVGMYDLVGQQFYTNQGGGAFTYGSEV